MQDGHRCGGRCEVRFLVVIAAVVLMLHGLIHPMGTAAYVKLTGVAGLPYGHSTGQTSREGSHAA